MSSVEVTKEGNLLRVVSCPVCKSQAFRPLHNRSGIPIERCADCGLQVQQPQPTDARLTEIYGPNYFIDFPDDPTFMDRVTELKTGTARLQLEDLKQYAKSHSIGLTKKRFLEIGPGHGYMLLEALRAGFDVSGLDYSEHAAQRANQKLGGNYVRSGTLEAAPAEFGDFDVIALCDVIEHLRDPRLFLQVAFDRIRPGGVLLIATISTSSWSARLMGSHWMEYKPEHLFYFNETNIVGILKSAGFVDSVVTRGRKVLSYDYIAGHFIKFPVPLVTPIARLGLKILPDWLVRRQFETVPSGFNVIARKPF